MSGGRGPGAVPRPHLLAPLICTAALLAGLVLDADTGAWVFLAVYTALACAAAGAAARVAVPRREVAGNRCEAGASVRALLPESTT